MPLMAKPVAPSLKTKILAIEPLWLLLLSPLLMFPGRFLADAWQPFIVLATLGFWPFHWLWQGSVLPRTPVRLVALLFLLSVPLSILVSTDPVRSWEAASYLVLGVAWAAALINHPATQQKPQMVVWALLLIALGLSLVGPFIVVQTSLSSSMITPVLRAAEPIAAALGETINPNILANALLAVIPFAAAFALRKGVTGKGWLQWLFAASALLMAAVIYLSESRGALLALAVMLPLLLALRFPRLLWATPLAAIAVALFVVASGPGLLDALTAATGGSATSGFVERVELWQRGLFAIQDFPITGIGLGTYGTVIPLLYPFLIIPPNTFLPDAHNLPIQVGVDLGIPGLVTWLAMLICLFVMMAQVLRKTHDPLRWALAAAVVVSFVGYLVAGIFAATNWGVKPAFLPWLIGAVGVLVFRQQWLEENRPTEVSAPMDRAAPPAASEPHA